MGASHDPEGAASGAAAGGGGGDQRERWEVGQPDYMGSASFDNILRKIDSTMTTPGECGKREHGFPSLPSATPPARSPLGFRQQNTLANTFRPQSLVPHSNHARAVPSTLLFFFSMIFASTRSRSISALFPPRFEDSWLAALLSLERRAACATLPRPRNAACSRREARAPK